MVYLRIHELPRRRRSKKMSRTEKIRSRALATFAALAASAAAAAVLASPAAAASASGEAVLRPADHDKGRTLSGQGVQIVADNGASAAAGTLTLPLNSLEASSVASGASLSFDRGKRSVALTAISFDFAKGTLNGSLDGQQLAVFNLGGTANASASSASLQGGKLSLTGPAASALKQKLGLEQALVRRGVGMVWLSARGTPAPAPAPIEPVKPAATPIVAGSIGWGFVASWRSYVLLSPPAGSTEVSEGAAATGELTNPATTFGFPVSTGSYTPEPNDGPAELSVASKGSVKWAKPGHGIAEVRLSNLEVQFTPSGSWLIADVSTNFGAPKATEDVKFASLNAGAVKAVVAGNTVTWTAVPATLTAAGAESFAGFYQAGKELEPVTITAELG